jgi:hypothetical protein
MTFEDLNLIEPIRKALQQEGYTTPTPIQAEAIPIVTDGYDLLGCAQTGTGKTAAFSIPIIQKLYNQQQKERSRGIKALILTPTRELAIQIDESFEAYGRYANLRHAVIFGGVGQKPQTDALQRGVDILIATPGRLLDLINQGYVSLKSLDFFVLDEADRMLDMGFIHDIKRILPLLPKKRQSLFFSATMPPEIEKLASTILYKPEKVEVTPVSSTVDTIDQYIYYVEKKDKISLLTSLLANKSLESVLVDRINCRRYRSHLNLFGLVKNRTCQFFNFGRHRCRKEQRLTLFGQQGQNTFDIVYKSHVQHPVGFIQHKEIKTFQTYISLIDQVEQTSGCGDKYIHPALQRIGLRLLSHSSKNNCMAKVGITSVCFETLVNLNSQLTRWRKNKRFNTSATLFLLLIV